VGNQHTPLTNQQMTAEKRPWQTRRTALMWAYILRRLLLIIPTLVIILLVNFVIVQAAPGGPVEQAIAHLQGIGGASVGGGSSETMAALRAPAVAWTRLIKDIEKQYGFDKPAPERLWLMLKNYAQLDFGKAFSAAPPSPT
jgi:microcin C transport system permease protein